MSFPFARRLTCPLRRFARDERGNIAVIFGVALLPLIVAIGVAVDFSRASRARTAMQGALDSAVLMVAKERATSSMTDAELTAKAKAYFGALYTNSDAQNVSVTASYATSTSSGSTVVMTGSGSIATAFMTVMGISSVPYAASSAANWGSTKLRVALALDNTGSMSSAGKMTALKSAATTLITQLGATASSNGDVYISIVPFATDVHPASGLLSSSEIDYSSWSTTGSIEEGWTCGSRYNAQSKTMLCGSSNNSVSKWNGCVMDRNQNYDVLTTAPTTTATAFPADQSSYCPTEIAPLSYNWTSLKSTISAMDASGNTNQPIGLVWAWQTLLQTAPFNAPAEDSDVTYVKAIILLSDGLNTHDRWYSSATSIDARQKLLCDNIKAAGIILYTIQVNTGGDDTSSVLSYCASSSDKFFMLTSATQVLTTFDTIGSSLSALRLSQ